jgi:hypothetical protein
MASPAVTSALQAVEAAPTAVRLTQYTSIFRQIIASTENLTENLNVYTRTLLDDALDRDQLLLLATALNDAYKSMDFQNSDIKNEAGEKLSSLLHSKFAAADRDRM